MGKTAKAILMLLFAVILGACSSSKPMMEPYHVIPKRTVKAKATPPEKEIIRKVSGEKKETEVVYSNPSSSVSAVHGHALSAKKELHSLSISYDSINAYDLITSLFNNVLKSNLVIDAPLKFPVSVYVSGNFTTEEVVGLVREILRNHNTVLLQEGRTYIIKPASYRPKASPLKGNAYWLYKPQFTSPRSLYQALSTLIAPGMVIRVVDDAIFVVGDRETMLSLRNLVRVLDRDVLAAKSIKIFKLAYAEPKDLVREVDLVMRYSKVSRDSYSLIPVDRLGYVVALASSDKLMAHITALVKLLDSEEESKEKNVYIYKVQYVKVDKIFDTLQKLLSKGQTITTRKTKGKKRESLIISEAVKIVPDETNNALLIEATPEDYKKIRDIISELDVMPRQVLIEVLIAEITLNEQLENGIEWWLKAYSKSYSAEIASTFGLAGNRGNLFGFTYYGIDPDHFWNFLYFLATKSKITILSSPHILVRDNQEASIDVGQEVPILTMETVGTTQIQGSSAIDRRIEYRDVGVILTVKPHISEEGFITLEISQETSSAERNTVSGIDSPIILKRKVHTTLMVQDEHSVILGGIINRKRNTVNKKVPLLGDIPFVGKLFSYTSKEEERTELIIMITPHVIRSVKEADVISGVFEEKLKQLMGKQKR